MEIIFVWNCVEGSTLSSILNSTNQLNLALFLNPLSLLILFILWMIYRFLLVSFQSSHLFFVRITAQILVSLSAAKAAFEVSPRESEYTFITFIFSVLTIACPLFFDFVFILFFALCLFLSFCCFLIGAISFHLQLIFIYFQSP